MPPPPLAAVPADAPAEGAPRVPPPFPVVAPPATGKTAPPIPHIAVTSEAPVEEVPPPKKKPEQSRAFKMGVAGAGLAALLVLAGGGYFVWTNYISPPPPPPPPPVAAKPKPAAPAAAPVTSSIATKPAAPLTPSDTVNALAKVPVNAINKTKEVLNTRRESGQLDVDAIAAGTTPPATGAPGNATKPATAAPTAPKPVVNSSATLAPGVSATAADVEAVVEAAPAFRTFVANTKITGVIAGTPGKIILNGRLARAGDVVDSALGVTFDRIDAERKQLVFKDKTGAIVTKKY